jgi:tRNA acetyltransferase TAN1
MQPNLLITYNPAHPGKAEKEVRAILDDFAEFEFIDAKTPGVFLVHAQDVKKTVAKMKKLPADSFEYTYKWVPIDKWVKSDVAEISKILKSYNDEISEHQSWKLLLFKRMYKEHGTDKLIQLLTDNIQKENVDLQNPEKLVVVEIVGEKAGLSLLDKNEYLDTQKL